MKAIAKKLAAKSLHFQMPALEPVIFVTGVHRYTQIGGQDLGAHHLYLWWSSKHTAAAMRSSV
jgi:hypothetical protein